MGSNFDSGRGACAMLEISAAADLAAATKVLERIALELRPIVGSGTECLGQWSKESAFALQSAGLRDASDDLPDGAANLERLVRAVCYEAVEKMLQVVADPWRWWRDLGDFKLSERASARPEA
jgi:hypothetical protein